MITLRKKTINYEEIVRSHFSTHTHTINFFGLTKIQKIKCYANGNHYFLITFSHIDFEKLN